mgnify:CR=1 FL=1
MHFHLFSVLSFEFGPGGKRGLASPLLRHAVVYHECGGQLLDAEIRAKDRLELQVRQLLRRVEELESNNAELRSERDSARHELSLHMQNWDSLQEEHSRAEENARLLTRQQKVYKVSGACLLPHQVVPTLLFFLLGEGLMHGTTVSLS